MRKSFILMAAGAILTQALFAAESFPGKILKKNGGWCWYQDERAIAEDGKVIFGSVKSPEGDIDISSWDLKSGEVYSATLDHAFNVDDHAAPALLKLEDGRILATWSSHGNAKEKSKNGVLFYTATKRAADISNWDDVSQNPYKGCYNNLYALSAENGRIYDFSRSYGFNPNWYYSDDGSKTFNYGGRFLLWKFNPKDPKKTKLDGNRPYVKYASNNVDAVHFASTEDHPRAYDNSIYHGYMKGGKLYKTDGAFVADLSKDRDSAPKPTDFTRVFEGDAESVAWIIDLHLDEAGLPVLLFSVQKNCGALRDTRSHPAPDMFYYYARFDGKIWQVNEMARAGNALYGVECDYTGLCAINPADVNTVYISTDANPQSGAPLISAADAARHYEIFKGRTKDFGRTWEWTPVTKDSVCDNIRPIVPFAPKGFDGTVLLWLRGKLRTFCDYSLDVAGWVDPEK